MTRMDQVFKAYDVRGTVPDQLDATMCRAIGRAMARFAGAPEILMARDMRESGVELSQAFSDGVRCRRGGRHRPRDGARPTSSTSRPDISTPPARCSPPRTTRRSTTASSSASPVPARSAATPGWPRSRPRPRACWASRRATLTAPVARAQPARRVGGARDLLRRPGLAATPQGRGRHRQRHGGAGRARPSSPASRSPSRSSFPSSTATFPTTRPTRYSPRTWSTSRRPCWPKGPTSAWPSTATPTASSWSTSGPSRCRAR